MEIEMPDMAKNVIGKLVDEAAELMAKKKIAMKTYIEPIDEAIEVIKQKIIVEWRVVPSEKKFDGKTSGAHVTVSQKVTKSIDLEAILKEKLGIAEINEETLAKALSLSAADFETKFMKVSYGKPSARIYE